MTDVRVDLSGPWFDGTAARVINAFLDESKHDIADEGLNLMHQSASAFKRPTGYWESQLATDMAGSDIVIGDDVIYNAWLEGVSNRNQTTRFRGYRIWRRSVGQLRLEAPIIAIRTLRRFIGRLGG